MRPYDRLFTVCMALIVTSALTGCSSTQGDPADGALPDAASPDAAALDAGVDARVEPDAAAPDAGFVCDPPAEAGSLYALEASSLSELRTVSLCEYRGEVLLIANIAAQCGYTPQLGTLAELQTQYGSQGLQVLGFYCDQFGQQAGSEDEREVCEANYGVNFPRFEIIDVNGPSEHPVFTWLKGQDGGGDVLWNFEKFLVSRSGALLGRWRSATEPDDPEVTEAITDALAAP